MKKLTPATILVLGICLNLCVALTIPNFVVPPRWEVQRTKAMWNFVMCATPSLFAALVLIRLRGRGFVTIGCIALVPGILWLSYSIQILCKAFAH